MTTDHFRVILVEDEILIAESLRILLENHGFEIAANCQTFEEALEEIDSCEFDILLTDINLGDGTAEKSGIQLAHLCKENCKKPIIFLTAYADIETIKKSSAVKPAGYLVKPINEQTLFATMQLALESEDTGVYKEDVSPTSVDYIFIKIGKSNVKIFWKDVHSITSIKNYVKLNTIHNHKNLLVRSSLLNFITNILPDSFQSQYIKANRNTYLQKSAIISYSDNEYTTNFGVFNKNGEIDI